MRAPGGLQESGINASSPNTWAATHWGNISWSQFTHCPVPSPGIHAPLQKSLLSQGHLGSLTPLGILLWVNVTSVLMATCWFCDQKTFLTLSFGLQINSNSEKPRRKTLFREKSWYLKSGGRVPPFDLWAAQDSNTQTSKGSWAVECHLILSSHQQDEMTSFWRIGPVSVWSEAQAVSKKASYQQCPCSPLLSLL